MYCYICPDDTVISLKLTLSQPLYGVAQGDIYAPVKDADVKITGAQGTGQLVFDNATEKYVLNTSSYPVDYGQTYKITVTTSSGDVATAETTVPGSTVAIAGVTVDRINEKYASYDRIKMQFNDIPSVTNYYRMAGMFAAVMPFMNDTLRSDMTINEIYTDNEHDGEAAEMVGRFYLQSDSMCYYDLFLYSTSASYYNFHRSLRNYTGDNPFAEPALTYTNVKGGFGCFGAYVRTRFRYKK